MTINFKSVLDHIGSFLKEVLVDGTKVAQIAEPVVDIAFPSIATLYNFTVQQASMAEAAAGEAQGSGAQKLAAVVASVGPYATAILKEAGVPAPTNDQIAVYVNAVVASLKALPAPVAASDPAAS